MIEINSTDTNKLVNLEIGQIVTGRVSSIGRDYALIAVDKYDFILPKEEISWTKNNRIKDYIKLDDVIEVVVVKIEDSRAMVSLKRCIPNPWIRIEEKYKKGIITKGKVVNIKEFGAFIELEPDVRGLLNKSEMSLDGKDDVQNLVSLNDSIDIQILSINKSECKLSFTRKPFLKTPWESFVENHYIGEITDAVVAKTEREKLHVLIDGVPSIITKENTSLNESQYISVHFSKLDIVKVIINKIDISQKMVDLSIISK